MKVEKDPFILPKEPKNSLQIIFWVIHEYTLLKNYSKTLSKEATLEVLKKYLFIMMLLIIIFIYFLFIIITSIVEYSYITTDTTSRELISLIVSLIFSIVVSIILGIRFKLGFGLEFMLAFILALAIVFVIIFTIAFGLEGAIVIGIAFNLGFGLAFGLRDSIVFGRVFGLIFAIALCIVSGVVFDFKNALLFSLLWCFTFYRVYLYFYYFIFHHVSLTSNPYLNNESIFFPLVFIDNKLITEARKNPFLGFKFSKFLYRYRQFNYKLGAKIRHSSYSGELLYYPLDDKKLDITFGEELNPSNNWYKVVKQLQEQIISYEKETQVSIKKERFLEVLNLLEQWKQQNLLESSKWNHYYFDAIDKWIEEANKVAKNLELQQQSLEPIQRNIYRYGTPLHPNRDELIFLGRDDIKRKLSTKIFRNEQIPAFMIQGQRRVGKTSLVNFLPELLGSRFCVVSFDCQGLSELTFTSFLTQLSEKINRKMNLKKELVFTKNWTEDWNTFEEFLESIILEDDIKLLIVLDEYEVLHQIFEQNPKEAEFILGRIRHFLQHQNSISFLFVGLYTFSDLENPNWSEYLVHYERFKVGYLNHEDSIKLITKPTEDFRLKYAKEVADRLYYYTAGHPALIQLLCNRIVDISNKNMDSTITMEIVESTVQDVVKDKELYPALVFWKQLCTDDDKKTIREILAGKKITNKKSLYKLEDYGFVVDGEVLVPIFKLWLEKFESIVD